MKEIFKAVKGYEGIYEVSNFGRIKSLANSGLKTEKLLKPGKSKCGYWLIVLCKKTNRTNYRIHRLVALTFIPNPKNKKTVNHINGIKTDNHVSNLEWNTHSENCLHSFRLELQNNSGEKNPRAKLKEKDILEIKDLLNSKKFKQYEIAELYKVKPATISHISTKRIWKY
jgi:predicted XRE-type DNA-binding protein